MDVRHEVGKFAPPVGLAILGATLFTGYNEYLAMQRSGTAIQIDASRPKIVQHDNPTIVTMNAHNELPDPDRIGDLKDELLKESSDVAFIQEVRRSAVPRIADAFKGWDIVYAYGDARQEFPLRVGLGNIIMSRTKLEDVKTEQVQSGIAKENRVVLSARTKLNVDGVDESVRLITTHIARQDNIQYEQLDKVKDAIRRMSAGEESAIVGGDFNMGPSTIKTQLGQIGFMAITSAERTFIASKDGDTYDHFAYDTRGTLGFVRVSVGKYFITDHKPVRAKIVNLRTLPESR
jgi:endonuclease/exonuclease/phosphatase family metal-dependent hydrolase